MQLSAQDAKEQGHAWARSDAQHGIVISRPRDQAVCASANLLGPLSGGGVGCVRAE
jgi:hypothetical protein